MPVSTSRASATRATASSRPRIGGSWYTQTDLAATFSYELEFWGRNRAAYDAALGQVKAAEVDAYAVRLLLASSVARAYAQLGRSFEDASAAGAS